MRVDRQRDLLREWSQQRGAAFTAGRRLPTTPEPIIRGGRIRQHTITATQITAGTITAVEIAAGTITAGVIKAEAITTEKLAAESVTAGKIKAGSIEAANIKAGTITATQIAANAITTEKLNAEAVTAAKIKAGTITASQISANTITASQIAAGTITASQIAANTITAGQIAAGTITATEIASHTITAAKILAGTITSTEIASATITGSNIAGATVTASNITVTKLSALSADLGTITAGTVTGATLRTGASGKRVVIDGEGLRAYNASEATVLNFSIATGNLAIKGKVEEGSEVPATVITGKLTNAQLEAIEAAKITGTITETQVGSEAISTPKLKAGAVTAAKITADTITAAEIAAGAITTTELAANSVTSEKIVAGTIEASDIKAGTVTATQIAAGTITGSNIAAGTIAASNIAVTELSALSANLGTITAGTITGSTFKTTGEETIIDNEGIRVIGGTSAEPTNPRLIRFYNKVGGTQIARISARSNAAGTTLLGDLTMSAASSPAASAAIKFQAASTGAQVIAESILGTGFGSIIIVDDERQSEFLQLGSLAKTRLNAGRFKGNGEIVSGEGFTVTRTAAGKYTIKFTTAFTVEPVVDIQHVGAGFSDNNVLPISTKEFKIESFNGVSGALEDHELMFTAIG